MAGAPSSTRLSDSTWWRDQQDHSGRAGLLIVIHIYHASQTFPGSAGSKGCYLVRYLFHSTYSSRAGFGVLQGFCSHGEMPDPATTLHCVMNTPDYCLDLKRLPFYVREPHFYIYSL